MKDKKTFSYKMTYNYRKLKYNINRLWFLHKFKLSIILIVFALIVTYFYQNIFVSIGSGEQGVLWYRISGTNMERIYDEGLHFVCPWDKMYIYNVRVQAVNDTMSILTSQGLTVKFNITYRFYPDKLELPKIHKILGPKYNESYVQPEIKAAAMSILGNYTPEKLYTMSTQVIQATIKQYVLKELYDQDIVLEDFLINKIELPIKISNAIEDKLSKEQLLLEFDYRIGIAEKERARKEIEAEGINKFESISGVSMLKWRGLDVTEKLTTSPNSKVIIVGTSDKDLPVILNSESK